MQTIESETLYRRLQQHLDRMPVAFPPTPSGVEIRILERLFTPEEAEIALELSAIPEPVATVHRRFGSRITLEELRCKLERDPARATCSPSRASVIVCAAPRTDSQPHRLHPTPQLHRAPPENFEETLSTAPTPLEAALRARVI